MNDYHDVRSWSKQHRQEVLHEVRMKGVRVNELSARQLERTTAA